MTLHSPAVAQWDVIGDYISAMFADHDENWSVWKALCIYEMAREVIMFAKTTSATIYRTAHNGHNG